MSLQSKIYRVEPMSLAAALFACIAAVAPAILLFLYLSNNHSSREYPVDMSNHHATMNNCVDNAVRVIAPTKMTIAMYERIWRTCGNQIFNGLYLDSFLVNREKLIRQELDERVTLWLVVTITVSGVALSATQLWMSFKVQAGAAADTELALQAGKISVRSSITGVVILALSLAFFMIYVVYIYSIRELPLDRPANLLQGTSGQNPGSATE